MISSETDFVTFNNEKAIIRNRLVKTNQFALSALTKPFKSAKITMVRYG